jgi:hypothetical protein
MNCKSGQNFSQGCQSSQGVQYAQLRLLGLWRVVAMSIVILSVASCSLFSKAKPEQTIVERVLKKKIVMTGFAVNRPTQVSDLDDIAQGMPREMLSRLETSGSFLVRQSKNLLSYDLKQEAPSTQLVRQVAAENDAQFVVAGEIRNAGVRADSKFFGLWESRSRHIEIEFSIYDGVSGVKLSHHHLVRYADSDAKVGRDKPFGSNAFFATSYGQAIDAVLNESVAWIRKDLAIFPMLAKIIKINDKQIIFDVGATSNLAVGDSGLIISDYDQLPMSGLTSQSARTVQYGIPQASMGAMTVQQVQYPFAVGELTADTEFATMKIKVGDYVRFDALR